MLGVIFFAIAALFATSCSAMPCKEGKGAPVEKTYELAEFSKISSKLPGKLYIKQGSEQKVVVEAAENLQKDIELEVNDEGELSISGEGNLCDDVIVRLQVKNIEGLEILGAGDAFFEGAIKTGKLSVIVKGSGDVKIDNLEADGLKTTILGSGSIEGKTGALENLICEIKGSGNIDLQELPTKNLQAKIFGSGDVSANVSELIDAEIFGSGDVKYKNSPKNVNSSVFGSGNIRKIK